MQGFPLNTPTDALLIAHGLPRDIPHFPLRKSSASPISPLSQGHGCRLKLFSCVDGNYTDCIDYLADFSLRVFVRTIARNAHLL